MTFEKFVGPVMKCQICSSAPLQTILALGHHPLPSSYLTEEQMHQGEVSYPLNFVRCDACGLLQLDHIVDPKLVFPPEYPYQTGLTNMLVRNFQSLAETVIPMFGLNEKSLVIDIGSNDGTLLKAFMERGTRVLGIEPTNVSKLANERGIETIKEYISVDVARKIVESHGKADVVTAANVFAHINNLTEVIESIKELLTDDGVFISESQYLLDILEKLEFDTIYHEHLRFYSLKPLQRLFELTGMSIVDAEHIPAAGGSIRVYAKKGQHASSTRVAELIAAEEAAGINDTSALKRFAERAIKTKRDLLALLLECKTKGRIASVGAPVRANTLLNFAHVDASLLDYCGEKGGSPKIGMFTPGMHIPVVDEKEFFENQPEFAFVNSWHIGDELIKKLKDLGYKGRFIVPLPEPRLVE
ncbi:MAG: class I SAM-dependent methyltransferase [Patescibacteria group bacterium]